MTTAIILAGGLGTRLRSVLPDIPKPMAPINRRPFLEYQMEYWIAQGIKEFIISVGYLRDQIIGHFGDDYHGCSVQYSVEEVQLGTGGGVLAAIQYLSSDLPFLLLNGDTFFEVDLFALQAFHRESESEWTFSMFRAAESGRYMEMQVDSDGRLTDVDLTLGVEGALANGGVYLIDPKVLAASGWTAGDKFSLEADLVPNAFKRGVRFFGFESDGKFIDIGVPGDYVRAPSVLTSGLL
jgi:D-glycero-alpha-D-manno-heptose 1-phosphate guanylyltransferase